MSFATFTHPWFDNSSAPLYLIHCPSIISDDEFEYFLDSQLYTLRNIDHRYAFVATMQGIGSLNAGQRAMWAAADERLRPIEAKWNVGQAMVVKSVLQRGVIRAVHWVSRPSYPWLVTDSMDDAIAWAKERLEIHDIIV